MSARESPLHNHLFKSPEIRTGRAQNYKIWVISCKRQMEATTDACCPSTSRGPDSGRELSQGGNECDYSFYTRDVCTKWLKSRSWRGNEALSAKTMVGFES